MCEGLCVSVCQFVSVRLLGHGVVVKQPGIVEKN
jgi:hypothetical protein